jgi:DMSO/TMAO reductase YedYZ heme-binding membrane subunit
MSPELQKTEPTRMRAARRFSIQRRPSGDLRRRLLLHHVPLALASAAVLVLFMTVPPFDANRYPPGNIFTDWYPREDFPGGGPMGQGGSHQPPEQQGSDHQIPPDKLEQIPPEHRGGQPGPAGPHEGMGQGSGFTRQFTIATGYVATGLLALTLLIGPGYLLLRRRNPISTYLARDAGTWAAVASVVHVIFGLELHASVIDPLPMFVQDGSPLTTSFGLGNWTGLAATVIVVALLATSSDLALRKLKARRWKRIQRLNYAFFALVIAHAFFYGAVLRTDSPYTLLLLLSVVAVLVGQAVGVWLYRRRYARRAAEAAS